MFDRHVRIVLLSAIVILFFCTAVNGQIRRPARFLPSADRVPCIDETDIAGQELSNTPRITFVSYLRSANECAAEEPKLRRSADEPTLPAGDKVLPPETPDIEFQQFGPQGFAIARARRQVLEILREGSSCSVWYARAEPDPWIKFASLHFRVDGDGEDTAIGDYSSFGLYYREPYVARAQQSVGPGSIITLNGNGAFFVLRAPSRVHWGAGGPLVEQLPRLLHVGSYFGGSVNAQVTTLLHEFAHIAGLLPIDSGEANSAILSTRNTDVVLSHCRKQIEASANRSVMLPESLARLGEAPGKP
jgi:hypothetical protein